MAKREKDVFVVLTHNYVPQQEDRSKWEVHEVCNIVDKVNFNSTRSATCIINITKRKVEKNRAGGYSDDDYHNLVDYLVKTYPDQFKAIGYEDTSGDTEQ